MLTHLQIKNFKAWQNTSDVRLAPLTVFFGSNSSGKSSLLQFLLMLRQTVESPDRRRVLHLGDSRTPVELGVYRDIVFGHDTVKKIEFSVQWKLAQPLQVRDVKSGDIFWGEQLRFSATIGESNSAGPLVDVAKYHLGDADISGLEIGIQSSEPGEYQLDCTNFKPVRNPGKPWPLPHPVRFYGFPDEAVAYFQNTGFLPDLTLALETQLRQLQYLGPLRVRPRRTYLWSGEVPGDVGFSGDKAVEALLAASDRFLSPGFRRHSRSFQVVIASWLQRMGLLEEFKIRPIAEGRKDYEVVVRTKGSSEIVSLPDVGFGISQVLPVVVSCFYPPPNSTVLMEQPELHLHPSVQARMADLLIEAIQSREHGEPRNIQFIVESHSEHFLRRLQRRIAEEQLSPEQVALYFCEPSRQGARLRELDVDLYGNITNWPEDFFGDEMGDLTAMTEAGMRRRMQKAG